MCARPRERTVVLGASDADGQTLQVSGHGWSRGIGPDGRETFEFEYFQGDNLRSFKVGDKVINAGRVGKVVAHRLINSTIEVEWAA